MHVVLLSARPARTASQLDSRKFQQTADKAPHRRKSFLCIKLVLIHSSMFKVSVCDKIRQPSLKLRILKQNAHHHIIIQMSNSLMVAPKTPSLILHPKSGGLLINRLKL